MEPLIDWVPAEDLKPNPKNPNKHSKEQIKRLAEIIKYQGFRHPIIVSKNSGFIVAGHGRLEAAKLLGEKKVPIHVQEFQSEDQEYAFVVSDNAIASWAELDFSQINAEVPSLGPDFDIDLLGIKDFVIEPVDKYGEEDEVPPIPTESKVRLGDLWLLGEHRILCGDCTIKENVCRVLDGNKADMVFTDPPYGISHKTNFHTHRGSKIHSSGKNSTDYRTIENDEKPFNASSIFEIYASEYFLWGADYYCETIPGFKDGSLVVWDKRTKQDGTSIENAWGSEFELCWSQKPHKREIARFIHCGLLSVDKDKRIHPTQKPVQLAEWFFDRWGKDAKIIWDGYLGSGSTLIACEKTGRKCYGMEIDPIYCQVILDRWAKYTGKEAVREDGVRYNELNGKT